LITTRLEQVSQFDIDQMIAPNEASPGPYVVLEVHDSGCGMDQVTLSRIFDPFFTTKFTGRGLGLAAVLGMVRGHKGALQVESAPGKGSCFKAIFPVSAGSPRNLELSASQKSLAGDETILVIDDEDTVRQTAKSALESYGYRVIVARNGKEGVRIFQDLSLQIAAVLLDMTMPVMSGEEALVRLKSIRPNIRVVLSSGYNEADATRRFTGKGLAGFVQKPYTASGLAETIKIALGKVSRPVA
jgi:CheY-like chemotaxis protein